MARRIRDATDGGGSSFFPCSTIACRRSSWSASIHILNSFFMGLVCPHQGHLSTTKFVYFEDAAEGEIESGGGANRRYVQEGHIFHPLTLRINTPPHFGHARNLEFRRQRFLAFAFQHSRQFLMPAFSSCERTRLSPRSSWPRRQHVLFLFSIESYFLSPSLETAIQSATDATNRKHICARYRRDILGDWLGPLRTPRQLRANRKTHESCLILVCKVRASRLRLMMGILDGLATDDGFTGIARVQIITFKIAAI